MTLRSMITAALMIVCQCAAASTAFAQAQITIVNGDGVGEGFNDLTPVAPVVGNPGTTLGAQRLNAFQAAADVWGNVLNSTVPIRVNAAMNPLSCSTNAGVLGSAGTEAVFSDFQGAPRTNTWYPVALANSLAGSDLDTSSDDIGAEFNSSVGNPGCLPALAWWYGVGAAAPAQTISFFNTVLHELAHGLGFQTFVTLSSGARLGGRNDIYMTFLDDHSQGSNWPALTDAQRAASAINTGNLHWTGARVNICARVILTSGIAGGHVRMYAPNPVEVGSSVSHFDTVLTPDELMEPFATAAFDRRLTERLLADLGWAITFQPGEPQLTINKFLVHPSTHHLRLFNLQIDGFTVRANVNGGSTGPQGVCPGNHTIGETGGTGTSLAQFHTVIGGDCAPDGTVNLAQGDNKTCTITNFDNIGGCSGQSHCCEPGVGTQGCKRCVPPDRECP
jgi:hypothetical protein